MKNRSVYGIDHIGFRDESDRREKRDNAGEQGGGGDLKNNWVILPMHVMFC